MFRLRNFDKLLEGVYGKLKTGDLLILSCSATKQMFPGQIPAMIRYDGPAYRVLRSFLRKWSWPLGVKIGVLSARYGLMGALAPTELYDQRMTVERAEQLAEETFRTLTNWSGNCSSLTIVCGKEYLPALQPERFGSLNIPEILVADGAIGMKLRHLSGFLQNRRGEQRRQRPEPRSRRLRSTEKIYPYGSTGIGTRASSAPVRARARPTPFWRLRCIFLCERAGAHHNSRTGCIPL